MRSMTISVWVPVEVVDSLDSAAHAKQISRSEFVARVLVSFTKGRPLARTRGDRDGKEAEALRILKAAPYDSSRDMVERLGEHGIKRGTGWVYARRRVHGR